MPGLFGNIVGGVLSEFGKSLEERASEARKVRLLELEDSIKARGQEREHKYGLERIGVQHKNQMDELTYSGDRSDSRQDRADARADARLDRQDALANDRQNRADERADARLDKAGQQALDQIKARADADGDPVMQTIRAEEGWYALHKSGKQTPITGADGKPLTPIRAYGERERDDVELTAGDQRMIAAVKDELTTTNDLGEEVEPTIQQIADELRKQGTAAAIKAADKLAQQGPAPSKPKLPNAPLKRDAGPGQPTKPKPTQYPNARWSARANAWVIEQKDPKGGPSKFFAVE